MPKRKSDLDVGFSNFGGGRSRAPIFFYYSTIFHIICQLFFLQLVAWDLTQALTLEIFIERIYTVILKDKSYIKTPPDDTPLMHYINIHQLLSILRDKQLTLSTVASYEDSSEATLSAPSYNEVSEHLLWKDNTPVQKDEDYAWHKKQGTDKSNKAFI